MECWWYMSWLIKGDTRSLDNSSYGGTHGGHVLFLETFTADAEGKVTMPRCLGAW